MCLILCITIGLTGCSNDFAKLEYNDAEKIVKNDHYAMYNDLYKLNDDNCFFEASKFDGRYTIWKKNIKKDTYVELHINLSISSGYAKVVLIDCNKNITVLVECSQDNFMNQSDWINVCLTNGINRIKIVGYDCKDINLEIYFDYPQLNFN